LFSTPNSGDPIRHINPHFGASHLLYSRKKLSIDLYSIYNQEMPFEKFTEAEKSDPQLYAKDAEGNPYTPAWYTLNIKFSLVQGEIFTFHMGCENILNKRYRPYASGISAPGRNFLLAASARI
jgi:hemoglobin/transferrin/lactoferrin receptor protein